MEQRPKDFVQVLVRKKNWKVELLIIDSFLFMNTGWISLIIQRSDIYGTIAESAIVDLRTGIDDITGFDSP